MAALCCASNKRSAILALKRVIGTRRSSRNPIGALCVGSFLLSADLDVFSLLDSI